ncbi:META domain-containing protein [Nocardia bovistercoris]|uniref:META domain-containing protein n=1 Tax=Nocardia bovistercoris TaxID=2785916 RepID=A0A931I695_9NOCA|nr:META domain-containing protein [Nocardia bovistercoris]MBH0774871.1 META domain-containing protein [Nocardia bovistercoris]
MTASRARLAPLLLLACLTAAACSDSDTSSTPTTSPSTEPPAATSPPTTAQPSTPMGHSYVSTAVTGTPIPGDTPLTLVFATDRLSANAGCNTLAGTVALEGETMRVGSLTSTLMACPEPQANADAWVNTLLAPTPTWRLDGATLTLTTADRTVTLSDKRAKQSKPMKGTEWLVTGTSTPDAYTTSQAISDAKPTLRIAEDGAVTGNAGCNRMSGSADVDPSGSPVTFHIAVTRMACAPEVMEVENAVLKALDGTATITLDGDTMSLRNQNGAGLTFKAN